MQVLGKALGDVQMVKGLLELDNTYQALEYALEVSLILINAAKMDKTVIIKDNETGEEEVLDILGSL